MIKQYKGTDLDKISKKNLKEDGYFAGVKYDGNYVQIYKVGDSVRFFTSGGKEFKLLDVEKELVELNPNIDFYIETEYIGVTDGKLGSRGNCTTTTWRTNFTKLIPCNANTSRFKCFDILYLRVDDKVLYHCDTDNDNFEERYAHFSEHDIKLGSNIDLVEFKVRTLDEAKAEAKDLCSQGWEGLFAFHTTHTYEEKGRSSLAIKIKAKQRADLFCINIEPGEGKYEGMIGSLVLIDSKDRIVRVGSGLSDIDRSKSISYFLNSVIEIGYEQILDTYIQPTFIRVREDKSKSEIN